MRKVINPCTCKVYGRNNPVDCFVEIRYKNGKLSLCGVVGPKSNGNCLGNAGQCSDSIRAGHPKWNDGWTRGMLDKLCDIWDRWHLNDLRPECEHQRELGWKEQAAEEITLHHYVLTDEARKAKEAAEKEAISALQKGETFTPTAEQTFAASLPGWIDIYEPVSDEMAPYYKPRRPLCDGDCGATETKTRGWVLFDESEKGILRKPCPVCGYEYGTKWLHEDVPQDVIDWLFALPDTKIRPAWV